MSVFRYYVPQSALDSWNSSREKPESVSSAEFLRSLGLAERLWDCLPELAVGNVHQITANGPDGSSGFWICPPRADGKKSGTQFWKADRMQAHKSHHGEYWVCWETEDVPGPMGLRRKRIVDGYEFGEGWIAPVIRQGAVACVPCSYSQLNGELTKEPTPDYQDIWEESGEWARKVFGASFDDGKLSIGTPEGMTVGEQFGVCARALSVNYRVGLEELSLLKVLTDETMELIVHAALDIEWMIDMSKRMFGKKKHREEAPAESGNS